MKHRCNVLPRLAALLLGASVALPLVAGESFRLASGQLLQAGMTRLQVYSLAGEPLFRDIDSHGINLDHRFPGGLTRETWSYLLEGSIGGTYEVTVTFKGGIVEDVHARQEGRM